MIVDQGCCWCLPRSRSWAFWNVCELKFEFLSFNTFLLAGFPFVIGTLLQTVFRVLIGFNLLLLVVVVVVVVGQTVGSISSKTLAYDCLYTLELCTVSMIATS